MKRTILFVLFIFSISVAQTVAQTISYTYDAAGNRLSRKTVLLQAKVKQQEPVDSVAVEETIGNRTIRVYPNPTRGSLGVEIEGGNTEDELQLVLYNGQGIELYNKKAEQGINPIDMNDYPVGWYILRVKAGTKITEIKIIKQ